MADKKRLLIYAHYYVPDVAATGQILRELAEGMLDEFCITVICTVPSYTGTVDDKYKDKRYYKETINGVQVFRIRVPEFRKNDKAGRIKNITAYFFGAMQATFKTGKQDYVYSISQPPIFGGFLGMWGKLIKHAKYIYNIQDFNPEQIEAVKYINNKFILNLLMKCDKFSCKQADKVIVVGRDMVETLENRFKHQNVPLHCFINNWIDEKSIYPLPKDNENVTAFKKRYGLDGKFVIMYSGNIGLYYDLEQLIKVIRKFCKITTKDELLEKSAITADGREVVFAFVGTGGILEQLISYKERHHMDNVVFIPYQSEENLIYSLNAGDVHWCVNAKGIKGVSVPSKCYGIMAVGKPILGVLENGSEASLILKDADCGLCCEPGEYYRVEQQINWFIQNAGTDRFEQMGKNGRDYLIKHFTKDMSVKKYIKEIKSC